MASGARLSAAGRAAWKSSVSLMEIAEDVLESAGAAAEPALLSSHPVQIVQSVGLLELNLVS